MITRIDRDSHKIEPILLQRYLQTTYESKRLYFHFHALPCIQMRHRTRILQPRLAPISQKIRGIFFIQLFSQICPRISVLEDRFRGFPEIVFEGINAI